MNQDSSRARSMRAQVGPSRPGRRAISLNQSVVGTLLEMAESNPGAATVLGELMKGDEFGLINVLHLDDMNIRGCQIWVAYKDHCGSDIERFRTAIKDRAPAMIETVNRIAEPQIGERAVEHGASFRR